MYVLLDQKHAGRHRPGFLKSLVCGCVCVCVCGRTHKCVCVWAHTQVCVRPSQDHKELEVLVRLRMICQIIPLLFMLIS